MDFTHRIRKRTKKKPLAIVLSGVGRKLRGRDNGDNVNNVQYKTDQNCHCKSPHNEYIIIKNYNKNNN
jgi:hypothetical protein